MTFTQRELWVYILTIMHTSSIAKQAGKETRQVIEMYLRKEMCPDISMDEWLKIEKDIVSYKNDVMGLMSMGVLGALGHRRMSDKDISFFKTLEGLTGNNKEVLMKLLEENKDKLTNSKEIYEEAYKKVMDAKKELEDSRK